MNTSVKGIIEMLLLHLIQDINIWQEIYKASKNLYNNKMITEIEQLINRKEENADVLQKQNILKKISKLRMSQKMPSEDLKNSLACYKNQGDMNIAKQLLKLNKCQKTDFIIEFISKCIHRLHFFKHITARFDKKLLYSLISLMTVEEFRKDQNFLSKQQYLQGVYIILKGMVVVNQNDELSQVHNSRQLRNTIFKKGDRIKSSIIPFKLTCLEESVSMIIIKNEIVRKICDFEQYNLLQMVKFLEKCFYPRLRDNSLSDCWQYLFSFKKISKKNSEKIINEGEVIKGIYLVLQGQVMLLKNKIKAPQIINKKPSYSNCNFKNLTYNNAQRYRLVKILTKGQFFCLQEYIDCQKYSRSPPLILKSKYTIRSNSSSEILYWSFAELDYLITITKKQLLYDLQIKCNKRIQQDEPSLERTQDFLNHPNTPESNELCLDEKFSLTEFIMNHKKSNKKRSQISQYKNQFRYSQYQLRDKQNSLQGILFENYALNRALSANENNFKSNKQEGIKKVTNVNQYNKSKLKKCSINQNLKNFVRSGRILSKKYKIK